MSQGAPPTSSIRTVGRPASAFPAKLLLGGALLARGYRGRPELTAERFVPDPFGDGTGGARLYRTGDLARRLADGALEFLGRIDQQVKVRGFRIELGEVESAIAAHPAISEVAVTAPAESAHSAVRRLVAFVVPRSPSPLDPAELRRFVLAHLPEFMVPTLWVTLTALPKTVNGKLDRRGLTVPQVAPALAPILPAGPSDPLQTALAAIWQEVLAVDSIAPDDSFFELGGHSLRALQLFGLIRERWPTTLRIVELFEYPTLRAMARRLRDEQAGVAPAAIDSGRAAARLENQRDQAERRQRARAEEAEA